jgi:hypothetical protein
MKIDIDERMIRRIVGFLGMAMPVVLAVWGFFILNGWHLQGSLSDYYSLRTRDAFVGILFVIGWLLFAYKGYEKLDGIAGKFAWIFALGVALFPNSGAGWERIIHFTSATCLFVVLASFSLFLFTKTKKSPPGLKNTLTNFRFGALPPDKSVTFRKKARNGVYIACGIIILACLLLLGLYMWLGQQTIIKEWNPTFWLETVMIWAFGVSWFVKGETILKDKE